MLRQLAQQRDPEVRRGTVAVHQKDRRAVERTADQEILFDATGVDLHVLMMSCGELGRCRGNRHNAAIRHVLEAR
jgi:hypothetical protein